jgi:hypothetical protein
MGKINAKFEFLHILVTTLKKVDQDKSEKTWKFRL